MSTVGSTKKDKTWSLVSNSSLSKTFALGSLESLKFRSSFLVWKIQVSRKILGLKALCVWKNFWTEKMLGPKKNLCLKKLLYLKFFLGPNRIFGKKKMMVWKNLSKQNFWTKKILGPKKFWVQKNWRSEKIFISRKS